MTKKTRVLSVLLAVLMCVTMLSVFSVPSFAIDPQDAVQKAAADVNYLSNNPFKTINKHPGYASPISATNIVFVDDNWVSVPNDTYVFLEYNLNGTPEVFKAIKGENAFGSIADAVTLRGRENMIIKVGAGTYSEPIASLAINGLKFYGNYAGVNPNVPGADIYTMDLNPERDDKLESVITGKWQWKKDTYNITVDGFKVTGAAQFSVYNSSAYSGDIYFYNNIFTQVSANYVINAGAGYTNSMYVKNNRFTNIGYIIAQFGGANSDIQFEYNYYENCTNSAFYANATGNSTGGESLMSFQNNVVKNCKNVVRLDYNNANYGSNLCFNRINDNIFYNCSGDYVVYEKMFPDYYKTTGAAPVVLLDPKSKTFITGNTFAAQGTTPAIKLEGRESYGGADANFIVSATENKYIFSNPSNTDNRAVLANITGIIDASYSYTNAESRTAAFSQDTSLGTIVTMPYYLDEDMTQLAAVGSLTWQKRTMDGYFDTTEGTYGVDGEKFLVYGKAKEGLINVFVDEASLVASNATYQLYYDFLLSREVDGNVVNLVGDRTALYILVTDKTTGQSSKYGFVINATTDKSKADFLYLYDGETDSDYTQYRVNDQKTVVYVTLDNETMYFPFYVVASPSAKVEYYTDAALKTKYTDSTYYMKPDDKTVIYAYITSGDGKTRKTVRMEFKRNGSDEVDAQVLRAKTPVENIIIFNNERKGIIYRPFAMIDEAQFDFEVSTGATYAIYTDATCTNLVSKQGDVKTLKIGDAITYFYVKVINPYGYEQIYTLVVYNDVKSTDNIITGITGYKLGNGLTIKDNVITIEASSTLALVNAHFETNAFADIKVYPDVQKTYSVAPSITMAVVNNRDVEVPTFQLGITGNISYFWVDVTSEVGETNSYSIIIKKPASTDAKFNDVSGHWAEKYINDVASLGIVNGIGNGQFAPNAYATRQQMAVVLCKMLGIESHAFRAVNLGNAFSDANDIAEWSYDYVKAAYTLKFMVGSDGKFNPNANITRQEFFVAIASVLKLDNNAAASTDLSKFSDAGSVAKWALPYTKACVKAGIVSGSNGMLNPTSNITRAEIVTIVSQVTTIRDDIIFE